MYKLLRLPSHLQRNMVEIFKRCNAFKTQDSLSAIFIVEGLQDLQALLSEGNSVQQRAYLCIDLLVKKSNDQGDKLILFLEELRASEPTSSFLGDALSKLKSELKELSNQSNRTNFPEPIHPISPKPQRFSEFGSYTNRDIELDIHPIISHPTQIQETLDSHLFEELKKLLSLQAWQEADREMTKILLDITDRQQQGRIREKDTEKLPVQVLWLMDELWLKYSNNRFGFSAQLHVWSRVSSNPNKLKTDFSYALFKKFADTVEWRVNEKWVDYEEIQFTSNAPIGHLPSLRMPITIVERKNLLSSWSESFRVILSHSVNSH